MKLILIDDDALTRLNWEIKARKENMILDTFSSFQEFINVETMHEKDTPIYIDSDLGGNSKGEELGKILFEKGFSEIYLSTGYAPENFKNMFWLKGIMGKNFPY